MSQKLPMLLHSIKELVNQRIKLLLSLAAGMMALVVATILVCNIIIESNKKYILPASTTQHARVGLVLGAGITRDGKPFRELQARLDSAAQALSKGQVDKLILSGDNRYVNYNEPDAMRQYLVQVKHVDTNKLQPDYAGRSTYESCERASKVFGLHETILFSAESHLPRAIYLCRSFGITAYGISSGVEANNSTRRELLARVKALFNVYIDGEHTILGTPIKV